MAIGPAVVQALHALGHKIRCIQASTGLYRLTVTLYLYSHRFKPKRGQVKYNRHKQYKGWKYRTPEEKQAAIDKCLGFKCTCHSKVNTYQKKNGAMRYIIDNGKVFAIA